MIDLGGLAKGAAADAALAYLVHLEGALVDLGGDVRTHGQPDTGDTWNIGYADPDGAQLDVVALESGGAVATSSTAHRRWQRGGESVHHIIDPRTGAPAHSDVVQCSVIADTTEHAEVAAKLGVVLGPRIFS